jgi:hypothetical protein
VIRRVTWIHFLYRSINPSDSPYCYSRFLSSYTSLNQSHPFNMTADASVYAPLTNAAYRAPAVKQPAMKSSTTTGKKPWRETPLVESANLSEAAGWYGAHSFLASRPFRIIHTAMHQRSTHTVPLATAAVLYPYLMAAVQVSTRDLGLSESIAMVAQMTQIAKPQKQNLPQTRNPPTLRLLQKPWHRTLLPTRPLALHPPSSRTLLRLLRR